MSEFSVERLPTSPPASRPAGVPHLLSLAFILGAFALGTSEHVIAGIVPRLSEALAVPVSSIGLLVTAYAGTAVIAGPVLSLLTARIPLRALTLSALAVYAAGTMLAIFASSFPALLTARIVTGALHTTVLVSFMLTAIRLAPDGQQGRTVGRITLGLGVATVIGVPVGNALAEAWNWQWAFAFIAALVVATLATMLVVFPDDRAPRGEAGWRSPRTLTRGSVLGGVAMSALAGLGAMTLLAFAVPSLLMLVSQTTQSPRCSWSTGQLAWPGTSSAADSPTADSRGHSSSPSPPLESPCSSRACWPEAASER